MSGKGERTYTGRHTFNTNSNSNSNNISNDVSIISYVALEDTFL